MGRYNRLPYPLKPTSGANMKPGRVLGMTLRTYTVNLMNKGVMSTGTVSAKDAKEAINNARSKYKYSGFKVLSVSLQK